MGTPNWWVTDVLNSLGQTYLAAWIIWVVVAITLHELAHGWVAIWRGDRTPIETGHMTWNPVVHMGLFSIIMFVVVGFAFGLMPVDESRMRGRWSGLMVALAGPLMNILLFLLCVVGAGAMLALAGADIAGMVGGGNTIAERVLTFFFVGAWLNCLLACFNLLPVPPLDGGRVLAGLSRRVRRIFFESENSVLIAIAALAALFLVAGPVIRNLATFVTLPAVLFVADLLGWSPPPPS
jgi:Zn-dependent protease